MKSFLLTAAALTLSTSALAWAPASKTDAGVRPDGSAKLAMTDGKSTKLAGADADMKIGGSKMADTKMGGWDEADLKAQMASWDSTAKGVMDWQAAKLDADMDSAKMIDGWAATGKVETAGAEGEGFAGDTKLMTASAKIDVGGKALADGAKTMTASTKMDGAMQSADLAAKDWKDVKDAIAMAELEVKEQGVAMADASLGKVAMGGPLEEVDTLTSQPAATSYPPCRPGRGDDNCIQLYERGVRTAAKSGGSDGMGGPLEPVDSGKMEAKGSATLGKQASAAGSTLVQAAYRTCKSRSDDNCIQA